MKTPSPPPIYYKMPNRLLSFERTYIYGVPASLKLYAIMLGGGTLIWSDFRYDTNIKTALRKHHISNRKADDNHGQNTWDIKSNVVKFSYVILLYNQYNLYMLASETE